MTSLVRRILTLVACLLLLVSILASRDAAAESWPDISAALPGVGGGEKDSALIAGIEAYAEAEHVPGAQENVSDWLVYLTQTRRIPAERVTVLRDGQATLESMRRHGATTAARAEPGGTLWFVFIGHGMPSKDGKDGLLVGADARRSAESLYERSLLRSELLELLAKGKQARTVVLLDACFSGRSSTGQTLVKGLQPLLAVSGPTYVDGRTILLTAARSDQFAGPLPRAERMRPAFSYLALGALRGWASDETGEVKAGALVRFAEKALRLAKDRVQTPELAAGSPAAVLGRGSEPAPRLASIDRAGPDPWAALARWKKAAKKDVIQWVPIPGGSFVMGSDAAGSRPAHRVAMKGFELAKSPVTFGQYRVCVEAGACTPPIHSCMNHAFMADDQPVVCVRWDQAKAFSQWVGGRLPSEAEWEYAARSAGKESRYPWGDEAPDCERAVIDEGGEGCGKGSTWPVCAKPKGNSEQGLCDMIGNVWQWTQDWYRVSYEGAPLDGRAWEVYSNRGRVVRGVSWAPRKPSGTGITIDKVSDIADPRNRLDVDPGYRSVALGFRPARTRP